MSEATVQVCRACLELSSKTYPLVGNILNVQEDIASMLEYCISEKLDLGENLPQSVCLPCFKTIRIAYHFLIKFQESQEKLNEQKNEKELEDDDFNVEIIHNYSLKCSQETEDDETSVKDEPNSNDACEKIKIEALDSEMESITFLQKSQPEYLNLSLWKTPRYSRVLHQRRRKMKS
ncbi:hypothetical protein JTB14_023532 [Gonioctena quinquepunctata]|nr:hypothetical protein JTB14_023532 [Gonioctena quinquepunctata]